MANKTIIPLKEGNTNIKTAPPLGNLNNQNNNKAIQISPLFDREYELLNWNNTPFSYPGLVRIRTIGDGSCFFHAITKSFFMPYKEGIIDGVPLNKMEFIKNLRSDLAKKLGEKVNPNDPNSPRYYDVLSRGKLADFAKGVPQYTLENMQTQLNSNTPVDNVYNEFISNMLKKDIYLLDLITKDVYITGTDDDILYKNRDSIIILTMPGHYELIGLMSDSGILTLFSPTHPLIRAIRNRMNIKRTLKPRL